MEKYFEYLLDTGSETIPEDQTQLKRKNVNKIFSGSSVPVSYIDLTGHFSTRVSVNGRTLFEEYPNSQFVNGVEYFSIDSGDYFVTKDFNNNNFFYFKESYPNGSKIIYERTDFDSGFLEIKNDSGSNSMEFITIPNITGQITEDEPLDISDFFDRWGLFFEGESIYEENYAEFDLETGRVFAYKKDGELYSFKGETQDVFGIGFSPNQNDLYVDGLEKDLISSLELYSGVTMIETGIAGDIFIQKEKQNRFKI
jgi:hypothetical protein